MGKSNDIQSEYYIAPTLREFTQAILRQLNDPKGELTGEESVVDAFRVEDTDTEFPPCTIGIMLRREGLEGEESEIGTLYIPPHHAKRFM